jgi:hypothetical protein
MTTCTVCHETITHNGAEWAHKDGDIYCGTGDGAMALPCQHVYPARTLEDSSDLFTCSRCGEEVAYW